MFRQLRMICFDLDNTFWPVEPVIQAADQAVQEWLQSHYPALAAATSPAALRDARLELARLHPRQAHDMTWLRVEALAQCAARAGLPTQVGRDGFEVFIEARHRVEFYGDVQPALQLLGRRYRMATLSNGNADMRRIGLAHHFEFTLNAAALGAAKPDPRVFQKVLDLSGLAPAEVLYVGDDPEHDIAGPQRLGLRTAWVRRDSQRELPADVPPPDLILTTLSDLVSALQPLP